MYQILISLIDLLYMNPDVQYKQYFLYLMVVTETKNGKFAFHSQRRIENHNHLSEGKMKAKGTLKEYRVIGRKMPTESEPVTPLYR